MPHAFRLSERNQDAALKAISQAPDKYIAVFERKIALNDNYLRGRAEVLCRKLAGWTLRLVAPSRSREQNDKMWAMLTDVSRAKPEGRTHTPDVWKKLMMNACGHACQFEIGLDGKPFATGHSTSALKVGEMSDLIEFIYSYGATHGVKWSEPDRRPASNTA